MSDNLIVNRNNTTYQVDMENLRTIEDTDLLLVNRNGTTYTVTGDKVGTGGGDLTQVNLAPLNGTPEFEVTATTDLTSILPESSINYKWYRYSASTGGTGTLLQELTSDSAILDTYTTTGADQDNYIGCTVAYLGTAVTETARTQCLTAPGPIATMHGLRFDGNRQTYLGTSSTNISSKFTFSCWHKHVGASGTNTILNVADKHIAIEVQSSGAYSIDVGGINFTSSAGVATKNVWQHVVVSYDGSEVTLYVNGDEIGSTSGTEVISDGVITIGSYQGTANWFSGYLSEVYFADGKALAPTVFGKTFEPYGWGPLDSSQIKENIGDAVVQPYDTRANTDQVWSNTITYGGNFYPKLKDAFDGNVLNGTFDVSFSNNNDSVLWNSSTYNLSGNLQVYVGDGSLPIVINGLSAGTGPADGGWADLGNFSNIDTVQINPIQGSKAAILTAVKINGRILVDNGLWDASQNWSDNVTAPNGYANSAQPFNAFDGSTDTYCDTSGTGETLTITFPGGYDYTQKVEVYVRQRNVNASINGGSAVQVNGDDTSFAWADVVTGSGTMNSLEIIGTTNYCGLAGVRVDGAILIDSGAQWNTSQVWSSNVNTEWDSTNPPANAFDGSISTQTYGKGSSSTQGTISFTGVTNVTKLRLYYYTGGLNLATNKFTVTVNTNTTVDITALHPNQGTATTAQWVDVTSAFPANFELKTISCATNNQGGLFAVEVNGEILVDKGSFGSNGFYLPFDPTNTGVNYSGGVTSPDVGLEKNNAFKSQNDYTKTIASGTDLSSMTVVLPSNTTGSSFTWATDGEATTNSSSPINVVVKTSSGDYPYEFPTTGGGVVEDKTISFNSSTINSIVFTKPAGNGGTVGFKNPRIDGKILVDHNSIGVDDSGNKNNFHDANFSLLPYVPGDNVADWVNTGTWYYNRGGSVQDPADITDKALLFDGTNAGPSGPKGNPGYSRYIFANPITQGKQIELYVSVDTDSSANRDVKYKGTGSGEIKSIQTQFGDQLGVWMDITSTFSGDLEYVEWGNYGGGDTNRTPTALYMIRVDGEILLVPEYDVPPSVDSVSDTPLRDYSVLEIGDTQGATLGTYNGNLDTQGNNQNNYSSAVSNLKMSSGKYYAEFTTLQVPNYNAPYFGVAGANFTVNGGFESWDSIGATLSGVGVSSTGVVIGLAFDADGKSLDIYVDGVKTDSSNITDYLGDGPYEFYYAAYGAGQISPDIRSNFGQQPFDASNATYNQATGTVEIPAGLSPYEAQANTDQVWSTSGDNTNVGFGTSWVDGFDGDSASYVVSDEYSSITWDNGSKLGTNATLYLRRQPSAAITVIINGSTTNAEGVSWVDFIPNDNQITPINIGDGIQSFTLGRNGAGNSGFYFHKLEVDGRLLVDNGVWNRSQNWSEITTPSNTDTQFPYERGFDGVITGDGGTDGFAGWLNSATPITITFPAGINVNSSVDIWSGDGSAAAHTAAITVDTTTQTSASASGYVSEKSFTASGELKSIRLTTGGGGVRFYGIAIDGEILVDGGDQWNTSQVWSSSVINPFPTNDNNPSAAFIASDPLTQQDGITALTDGTTTVSTVTLPITLNNSTVRVYFNLNASQSSFSQMLAGDKSTTTSVPVNGRYYTELTGCTGNNITMTFSYSGGAGSTNYIYQYVVDGEILVDPSGGTYNTLFQTWEESNVVVFRARIAAADLLMAALTEHAQTYDASENYCEGSVIKAFDELWIAVNDAAPTTFADLPSLVSHSNWERLGISV